MGRGKASFPRSTETLVGLLRTAIRREADTDDRAFVGVEAAQVGAGRGIDPSGSQPADVGRRFTGERGSVPEGDQRQRGEEAPGLTGPRRVTGHQRQNAG